MANVGVLAGVAVLAVVAGWVATVRGASRTRRHLWTLAPTTSIGSLDPESGRATVVGTARATDTGTQPAAASDGDCLVEGRPVRVTRASHARNPNNPNDELLSRHRFPLWTTGYEGSMVPMEVEDGSSAVRVEFDEDPLVVTPGLSSGSGAVEPGDTVAVRGAVGRGDDHAAVLEPGEEGLRIGGGSPGELRPGLALGVVVLVVGLALLLGGVGSALLFLGEVLGS